ncbi:hypothetical protein [Desertivirga arenae]|uniref:hypothetical protein n=1 Tax=Desertivirga arenae TaxID=2810309 RepID=UPI001A97CCEB|nr:hypothetical protein [Pedobacter sp. SYSU D00823]
MKEEILTVITLLAGINAFITAPASENPILLFSTAIVSCYLAYYFQNRKYQKKHQEEHAD